MRIIIDDGNEQSCPKEETIKVDKIISVGSDIETEHDVVKEDKNGYRNQCFRYTGFEDIKIRVQRKRA